MRNIGILTLFIFACAVSAQAGLPADGALVLFFSRPTLSGPFSGQLAQPGHADLKRSFQAMAESSDAAALKTSLGVDMDIADLAAACEEAKTLWNTPSAPAPSFMMKTPRSFDGIQNTAGRLSRFSAPGKSGALFDGSDNDDPPSPSISLTGGYGQTKNERPFSQVGLMARFPVFPTQTNAYGNVGVSFGVNYSVAEKKERLIDQGIVAQSQYNGPGYWEVYAQDFERKSGLNLLEFVRLSYQTPRIGRLTLEAGMGLGFGWDDPRTRVEREAVYSEYQGSGWCTGYNYNGYPYSYWCDHWYSRQEPTQTLSVSEGKKTSGFLHTVYGAATVAVTDNLGLRVEVNRFATWAAQSSGTAINGGLTYVFGK